MFAKVWEPIPFLNRLKINQNYRVVEESPIITAVNIQLSRNGSDSCMAIKLKTSIISAFLLWW